MYALYSLALGALSALGAVLIHQSLPPFGVAFAVIASASAIWWTGRYTGKRRYKLLAAFAWNVVIFKAATFGVGHELLLQGDPQGAALLVIGFFLNLFIIFTRV